jgi:hypothetical protein
MAAVRFLAVVLLASVLCGCQALKNDPMIGDNPWQPGSAVPPNAR